MNFGDREGPAVEQTPARARRSCFGCKYFEDHMVVHRFLGPNEYEANCAHPEFQKDGVFKWRRIGKHDGNWPETPGWCPYVKEST